MPSSYLLKHQILNLGLGRQVEELIFNILFTIDLYHLVCEEHIIQLFILAFRDILSAYSMR